MFGLCGLKGRMSRLYTDRRNANRSARILDSEFAIEWMIDNVDGL